MDKSKLFNKLKNLKKYNKLRNSNHKQPIYVTEHLPEAFVSQRALSFNISDEQKRTIKNGKQKNGEYLLYVDDKKLLAAQLSVQSISNTAYTFRLNERYALYVLDLILLFDLLADS